MTLTNLAAMTFLELKLAVPVTLTCSVPTKPALMVRVGVTVVLPSYTLLGGVRDAVNGAGVMKAVAVCPEAKL